MMWWWVCWWLAVEGELPVDKWSQRYRNWYYYPTWVIPPNPTGHDILNPQLTDVATVWEGANKSSVHGKWRMTYLMFNKTGYVTCFATSHDLVHWDTSHGVVFSFNPVPNTFDYGGVVLGGMWYKNVDVKGVRELKTVPHEGGDDRAWQLYGAYPHRGGYELRPGAEGAAFSTDDGWSWSRASVNGSALSILGASQWESDCIYQPFLVEHNGTLYDFYNAAHGGDEQSGVATLPVGAIPGVGSQASDSQWQRYEGNPVIRNGPTNYDSKMASDPKVYYDEDIKAWVMFYFGGLESSSRRRLPSRRMSGQQLSAGVPVSGLSWTNRSRRLVASRTKPRPRGLARKPPLPVGGGHADIMIAFSLDLVTWTKCNTPLYLAGGHPGGLDAQHAHKVSLVHDAASDTLYLFYTAVGPKGRGIALLTSKPLPT